MSIFFLGPPCVGKTTISKALADATNLALISGGDVARRIAERDESTKEALSRGEMAPESIMNSAMIKILRDLHPRHGIMDGYPRYWEQMADLLRFTDPPYHFVVIHAPLDRIYERQAKRGRDGDSDDVHEKRIELFLERTMPMINWLIEREACLNIDNSQDTLFANVDRIVAHTISYTKFKRHS